MPTKLGQNFLKDTVVLKRIIDAAKLTKEDVVLEVGPGKGVLTELLAKYCKKVVAIELDRKLIAPLRAKFENTANVEIIEGDILKINLPEILNSYKLTNYKLVANIPYYITAPIIRLFLETKYSPQDMVLMVQKEVAERICAVAGKMSILAVSVQYYAKPKILFEVSKKSFDPIPEVDSAVVRIVNNNLGLRNDTSDTINFFRVVRAGFSARRKTLANNLINSFQLSKYVVTDRIKRLELKTSVRAQELSISQWKQLTENLPLSE